MLPEQFVYLAFIINGVGSIHYLSETIRGKAKPNRITWLLWSIVPFIAFAAEVKQGVGLQSIFTFSAGFFPFLILLASLFNKNSYWHIEKFDVICGILSVAGLFLWLVTKVGNIAIFFSIFSDLLAAIPTIKKSYIAPETESSFTYFMAMISAGITILTSSSWTFAELGYPLYVFIVTFLIAILIQGKLGRKVISFRQQ